MCKRVLFRTLAGLFVLASASSQNNPDNTIRITVNLVQVDAVVTDSKGKQVTDLEAKDFEILQDISVNGTLVIPKGGLAFATVTEAQAKRRMARGGKLDINIDYVKLLDSEHAALRAVKD